MAKNSPDKRPNDLMSGIGIKFDSSRGILRETNAFVTVQVLPFGTDELLGGGFANGLGKSLSGEGVPGGQDPVVEGLATKVSHVFFSSPRQFHRICCKVDIEITRPFKVHLLLLV